MRSEPSEYIQVLCANVYSLNIYDILRNARVPMSERTSKGNCQRSTRTQSTRHYQFQLQIAMEIFHHFPCVCVCVGSCLGVDGNCRDPYYVDLIFSNWLAALLFPAQRGNPMLHETFFLSSSSSSSRILCRAIMFFCMFNLFQLNFCISKARNDANEDGSAGDGKSVKFH